MSKSVVLVPMAPTVDPPVLTADEQRAADVVAIKALFKDGRPVPGGLESFLLMQGFSAKAASEALDTWRTKGSWTAPNGSKWGG